LWPVALVILASGLLALIYVWRIVEVAYFRPSPDGATEIREAPLSMLIPLGVLCVACIYFGIDATATMDLATAAAVELIGSHP
jgi:multicomponent Na+:H+ antiporter subunit D